MNEATTSKRHLIILTLLIALAALVRLLALWDDEGSLLYEVGGLDAPQYLDMARRFVSGEWPDDKPFFWAPGYSVFLGLLSTISSSITWLKLAQVVLGTASCALVGVLARRTFDDARVAYAATAIAALYGPLVYYDLQISPASLDVFLWLLTLVLLIEARHRERVWLWLFAGIAAAASAVTRGAVLLLVPFIALWSLWPMRGLALRTLGMRGVSLAAFLAPIALVLALVTQHNVAADNAWGGRPRAESGSTAGLFLSYNLGINFILGNVAEHHAVNRVEHPLCLLNYKMLVFKPTLDGVAKPSEQSSMLMGEALAWIGAHPGEWLKLLGTKVLELVHGEEISRDTSIEASRLDNHVLAALIWKLGVAFPSGLVIPLALLGLVLGTKRSKEHALLLAALAAQAIFVLAFFVTTRYRLALCATAFPYAAYAVIAAWDAARARQRPAFGIAALAIALLAISNYGLSPLPRTHAAFEHDHLGALLDKAGKPDAAVAEWRTALAIDPHYAQAHFQLANYETKRSDLAAATKHYEAGLETAPTSFAARMAYGSLLIRQGRAEDGGEQLRRVLREVSSPRIRMTACMAAKRAKLDLGPECSR